VAKAAAIAQGTTNPNTANLRPYPNFNNVQPINPRWGNSIYNALQLKLEQRAAWGLSYLLSYTWAKYIDNGSEAYGVLGGSWPVDITAFGLSGPTPRRRFHIGSLLLMSGIFPLGLVGQKRCLALPM